MDKYSLLSGLQQIEEFKNHNRTSSPNDTYPASSFLATMWSDMCEQYLISNEMHIYERLNNSLLEALEIPIDCYASIQLYMAFMIVALTPGVQLTWDDELDINKKILLDYMEEIK